MKKVTLLIAFFLIFACAHTSSSKSPAVIRVPAGSNIPSLGMALDASYDEKTDGIIPGFKILSVAVVNNSLDIIQMDKSSDKWVLIDARGSRHDAIMDLRTEKPEVYLSLPEKLRGKMQYPILIQVGESKVIDLLFKDSVGLDGFRSVKFLSKLMNKAFEIISQD